MASMNPKTAAWYGGGVSAFLLPGAGSIFYVSSAARGGADTNDGLTPDTAWLRIDYAVGQCSGVTDDYIFVIDHDDATETYPIAVDVDHVHLFGNPWTGSGPYANLPRVRIVGDVDGFDVSADRFELAGFNINTTAQADTANLVHLLSTSSAHHIHHNTFAWNWWGSDFCLNFEVGGTAGSDSVVENNYFGAHGWNAAGNAIWLSGQCGRVVIRENLFIQTGFQDGGDCIALASLNHICVLNNEFVVKDAADGEAIQASVGSETNLFSGNVAFQGAVALGFNPFRDLGDNDWGLNYIGIAPAYPTTV